jgi:hypothetical protein
MLDHERTNVTEYVISEATDIIGEDECVVIRIVTTSRMAPAVADKERRQPRC